MGEKRVAGSPSQIEEEGTVRAEDAKDFACPFCPPKEKGLAWGGIVVATIVDSQVVRWGSDDQVHTFIFKLGHAAEAIAMVELE